MKITDQDYLTACSNGDGTYSLIKAAQWLVEAAGGKAISDEEAAEIVADGKRRTEERRRVCSLGT